MKYFIHIATVAMIAEIPFFIIVTLNSSFMFSKMFFFLYQKLIVAYNTNVIPVRKRDNYWRCDKISKHIFHLLNVIYFDTYKLDLFIKCF